jgi:hypothetical protein
MCVQPDWYSLAMKCFVNILRKLHFSLLIKKQTVLWMSVYTVFTIPTTMTNKKLHLKLFYLHGCCIEHFDLTQIIVNQPDVLVVSLDYCRKHNPRWFGGWVYQLKEEVEGLIHGPYFFPWCAYFFGTTNYTVFNCNIWNYTFRFLNLFITFYIIEII